MKHIDIPDHLVRGKALTEEQFDTLMGALKKELESVDLGQCFPEVSAAAKIMVGDFDAALNGDMDFDGVSVYDSHYLGFIASATATHLEKLLLKSDNEEDVVDIIDALRGGFGLGDNDPDCSETLAAIALSMIMERRDVFASECELMYAVGTRHGFMPCIDTLALLLERKRISLGKTAAPKIPRPAPAMVEVYADRMNGELGAAVFALSLDIPAEKMVLWMDALKTKNDLIDPAILLLMKHSSDEEMLRYALDILTAKDGRASIAALSAFSINELMTLVDLELVEGSVPSPLIFEIASTKPGNQKASEVYERYLSTVGQQAKERTTAVQAESRVSRSMRSPI